MTDVGSVSPVPSAYESILLCRSRKPPGVCKDERGASSSLSGPRDRGGLIPVYEGKPGIFSWRAEPSSPDTGGASGRPDRTVDSGSSGTDSQTGAHPSEQIH